MRVCLSVHYCEMEEIVWKKKLSCNSNYSILNPCLILQLFREGMSFFNQPNCNQPNILLPHTPKFILLCLTLTLQNVRFHDLHDKLSTRGKYDGSYKLIRNCLQGSKALVCFHRGPVLPSDRKDY